MEPKKKQFILSPQIIGKPDLIRLQRELDDLEDKVRDAKTKKSKDRISISRLLHKIANDNGFDLNQGKNRAELKGEIQKLIKSAPNLQLSFASVPNHEFMSKITDWFRQEIHPQTLISVGLQPTIAAGTVLRTTNKVFDLSLKKNLLAKQELLVSNLRGVHGQ